MYVTGYVTSLAVAMDGDKNGGVNGTALVERRYVHSYCVKVWGCCLVCSLDEKALIDAVC